VPPSAYIPLLPKIKYEYPAVKGIEIQYSDGSSRFIPQDTTSIKEIKKLNGLKDDKLSVGQAIRIPRDY